MKNWPYAKLSQLAKAYGGPEQLLEKISKTSAESAKRQTNKKWGIATPFIVAASIGAGVIATKLIEKHKSNKITDEDVEAAKSEIINGIREYDKMAENNPEAEPLPEITPEQADKEIDKMVEEILDDDK